MPPPFLSEAELVTLLKERRLWSDKVEQAIEQAKRSHARQLRDNGNPYVQEHIFPVAADIATHAEVGKISETEIIGALLHDTMEDDPAFSAGQCERLFGAHVTAIVVALTKTAEENRSTTESQKIIDNHRYLERLRKGPPEALLIKLADRCNNLASIATIKDSRPGKYERYIRETKELFIPLAKTSSKYFLDKLEAILQGLEKK